MNWLASIAKVKSFIKPGLIILIPVFLGCDEAEDTGTQFDLETNIDVNLAEFDFPSTNIYLDSLRTDGEERIMAGSYNDPLTGNITAEGYFQFNFSRGFKPGDTLTYDSVVLTLETASMLPFIGLSNYEIEVNELEDTLISNIIYLATKEEQKSRTVGRLNKMVRASVDSTISFRLFDLYGIELFEFLNDYPDSTSHFFKGLALTSQASTESMLMFNMTADTSNLRVYMSGDTASYFAEFDFLNSAHTYVTRDRSASEFTGIVEKQDFSLADGRTVLDPIAGLTTSFNIQALETFFDDNPSILINSALIDFSNQGFLTRDTLQGFYMYFRKEDGGIFSPAIVSELYAFSNIVMNDQGYLGNQTNPASIVYNLDTEQYISNPTLFFQSLYNNYQNTGQLTILDPFLGDTIPVTDLVLVNPFEMTLNQAVFNDSGIKLRLFYTEVN
jgi:hypothetical protein